jgi:fatty acid desaturase
MFYAEMTREQKQAALALRPALSWIVLLYTFLGYFAALACILVRSLPINIFGILLLTHTVVLSGLLNHELMHRAVVRSPRFNDFLGSVVSLLNGARYIPFDLLRRQHMAHHINKVGVDGFSITEWFKNKSRFTQTFLITLEYFYFPILTIFSRTRALFYPFWNVKYHHLRRRILIALLFQAVALFLFYKINPWSLLSLFISHILMINVFRLYDCYHHNFDLVPLGTKLQSRPDPYEQEHTFSSLFSRQKSIWNVLFLNYGYHNAHHYLFSAPWYHLPKIDKDMFGDTQPQHILFSDWVRFYHKNRINRIFNGLGTPRLENGHLRIEHFYGIIMNLSFMDYDFNDL